MNNIIKGKIVELRPAVLTDRRMVWEWSEHSDVAHFLLSSGQDEPHSFDQWCDGWKAHYFTDESPELGRGFIVLFKDDPVGFIAYNGIVGKKQVELDIWMNSEANCGKGFGPDAIQTLCGYLATELDIGTIGMQPSAQNPRAIQAYEKAGFVRTPATPEQIREEWGGVDSEDSVMMVKKITQPDS